VVLVPVPLGVVTASVPVVAPTGTVAVIFVAETTVNAVAGTPLKFTFVAPVNAKPLIVTKVPIGPLVGVKLVIFGVTTKEVALVTVPPGAVTTIGPVVAALGTLTVI